MLGPAGPDNRDEKCYVPCRWGVFIRAMYSGWSTGSFPGRGRPPCSGGWFCFVRRRRMSADNSCWRPSLRGRTRYSCISQHGSEAKGCGSHGASEYGRHGGAGSGRAVDHVILATGGSLSSFFLRAGRGNVVDDLFRRAQLEYGRSRPPGSRHRRRAGEMRDGGIHSLRLSP